MPFFLSFPWYGIRSNQYRLKVIRSLLWALKNSPRLMFYIVSNNSNNNQQPTTIMNKTKSFPNLNPK